MSQYAGDITPAEAWELLKSDPAAVLVDVRTEMEWEQIGVPDASSLGKEPAFIEWVRAGGVPNPGFVDEVKATGVEPGAPIVFLCRSGQRSIGAAIAATAAGLGPAYNVLEGFEGAPDAAGNRTVEGWKVAGLPWRQV
jgi:rhodanese-related sulfurtransferase